MLAAGGGNTLLTLAAGDWHDQLDIREVTEEPTSTVDLGGIWWNAGLITPYLSHAPGDVSAYIGTLSQSTALAIDSQATLNTLAGRLLAYQNNRWPAFRFTTGNWRYADIWPQEYVNTSQVTVRYTFASDLFIVRELAYEYDPAAGALLVTHTCEMETDAVVAGATIDIPEEPPAIPPPAIPPYGAWPPPGAAVDEGRRIVATDVGVFATDEIGDTSPVWYATNSGLTTVSDLQVYEIRRDPFRWWTSGGTLRRLWAFTRTGVWYMDSWPFGTWSQRITYAAFLVALGFADTLPNYCYNARMDFSIETDERYIVNASFPDWRGIPLGAHQQQCLIVCQDNAVVNSYELNSIRSGAEEHGYGMVRFANHSSGVKIYGVETRRPANVADARYQPYRTTTSGAAWAALDASYGFDSSAMYGFLSVPYESAGNSNDRYVLWGRASTQRESDDQAATFTAIPNVPAGVDYNHLGTGGHPDYIWLMSVRPDTDACIWTQDGGTAWTSLPLMALAYIATASHTVWQAGNLQSALLGGNYTAGAGSDAALFLWTPGAGWQDKTGNLLGFGVTEIRQIDRDSMGSA
jgi:hypothetical protein